jgi:hypothetical protein
VKRKLKRSQLWTIAVGVAAVILATFLALIAFGVLVLPGASPPAPVRVTQVEFTLDQGTNASGRGWFGPSTFNYTGIGYGFPYVVAPGGNFSIPLILENFDTVPHTVYSASASAPFTLTGTSPALPAEVRALQDDAGLQLFVKAPSTPGATLTLFITVNMLGPS